ncbi:MAG TPA: hypothetical protein VFP05_00680 [Thermomicrobiales bacterium]|nr:hypothetical protein [Thermomicrobiales bacterium]
MTAPRIEPEGVVLHFVDREEGAEILDRQAQKYLRMSGPEFARAFCAGELDIEETNVMRLYFLLGLAGIECNAGTDPD